MSVGKGILVILIVMVRLIHHAMLLVMRRMLIIKEEMFLEIWRHELLVHWVVWRRHLREEVAWGKRIEGSCFLRMWRIVAGLELVVKSVVEGGRVIRH